MTKNKSMKTNIEIVTSDSGRGKTKLFAEGISPIRNEVGIPTLHINKHTIQNYKPCRLTTHRERRLSRQKS